MSNFANRPTRDVRNLFIVKVKLTGVGDIQGRMNQEVHIHTVL